MSKVAGWGILSGQAEKGDKMKIKGFDRFTLYLIIVDIVILITAYIILRGY